MTTKLYKTTIAALAFSLVLVLVYAIAASASAWGGGGMMFKGDDTTVKNSNAAVVVNVSKVVADTGKNDVNGGDGGYGGGAFAWRGDATVGRGGDGAPGGKVESGNAAAFSGVMNSVNLNETVVRDDCGCDGWWGGNDDTRVINRNMAMVMNFADVEANTGKNDANGGYGGDGGGAVAIGSHSWWFFHTGGEATVGRAGDGAKGGLVASGNANARAETTNYVNHNLTRIVRGGEVAPD